MHARGSFATPATHQGAGATRRFFRQASKTVTTVVPARREYMKKVAVSSFACLFACVTNASPVILEPDEGHQVPLGGGALQFEPVPEWRAWQKLYTSLDAGSRKPVAPSDTLPGLLPGETDAVLQAGRAYLRELDGIMEEMRSEIDTRFRPRNAPPLPAWMDPDTEILLPDGISVKEILEPEGFYERYDARREWLLDSHRERLAQLIEPTSLEWLDNHVETDIAPFIRRVKLTRPPRPEELPASLRERAAIARERSASLPDLETPGATNPEVREYLRSRPDFGPLNSELSSLYNATVVPGLIAALNSDAQEENWAMNAHLLGQMGDESAVEVLIAFIRKGTTESISEAHDDARHAAFRSLGFLIKRTGSERALDYLIGGLTPGVWREREVKGIAPDADSYAEYDLRLSTYAVSGLAESGHPRAGEALRTLLRSPTPEQRQFRDDQRSTVTKWLELHDRVAERGEAQRTQP